MSLIQGNLSSLEAVSSLSQIKEYIVIRYAKKAPSVSFSLASSSFLP